MKREDFETLVAEALDTLPEFFQQKLENVDVVLEDWPDTETLRAVGARHPADLLGFYHGVPQTQRTHHYGLVLPDKISIYRRPIEMRCATEQAMRAMVARVVLHEIGHHFGMSEAQLRALGVY